MVNFTLYNNDCIDQMKQMADNSIDAIIVDPPYHLVQNSRNGSPQPGDLTTPYGRSGPSKSRGFMGKEWDGGDIAFKVAIWKECLRILKPGAYLCSFGGTRTSHRMICAIEDAGFIIRDKILYLFGSGFPKSHNISKAIDKKLGAERKIIGTRIVNVGIQGNNFSNNAASGEINITENATTEAKMWDGYGTALKPAYEDICLAQKPISEKTIAENVLKWGTGAINIDGCRISTNSDIDDPRLGGNGKWKTDNMAKNVYEGGYSGEEVESSKLGRWPAHLILGHSENCELIGSEQVKNQSGTISDNEPSEPAKNVYGKYNRIPFSKYGDENNMETVEKWECVEDCPVRMLNEQSGDKSSPWIGNDNIGKKDGIMFGGAPQSIDFKPEYKDKGGAARFFYTSKASRKERELGCENLPEKAGGSNAKGYTEDVANGQDRNRPVHNNHPTCKPISLMRYLAKLITPPNGTILDCFMGSGSTGIGAILEGFNFIGIEREKEYINIAHARITYWQNNPNGLMKPNKNKQKAITEQITNNWFDYEENKNE